MCRASGVSAESGSDGIEREIWVAGRGVPHIIAAKKCAGKQQLTGRVRACRPAVLEKKRKERVSRSWSGVRNCLPSEFGVICKGEQPDPLAAELVVGHFAPT